LWFKDVAFSLDIVRTGYKKATELWKALSAAEKQQNPNWLDPKFAFSDEKMLADLFQDFTLVAVLLSNGARISI
jgi:transcription-repair coupling factor (superfamily II helicase)